MASITGLHKKVEKVVNSVDKISIEDINELQRLWTCVTHGGQDEPAGILTDHPVYFRFEPYYMPTYAYNSFARRMADFVPDSLHMLAAGWGLMNARDKQALASFDKDTYLSIILEYEQGLTCTPEELEIFIESALDGFPERYKCVDDLRKESRGEAIDSDVKQAMDLAKEEIQRLEELGNIGFLMSTFGQDIDYWVFNVSLQRIAWISHNSISNYVSPGDAPNPHSPISVAQKNFIEKRKEVLLKATKDV